MTDIDKYINAIQITWVKRLTNDDDKDSNWKIIPKFYFNRYGQNFFIFKMNATNINIFPNIKENIPEFYLNVLQAWLNSKQNTESQNLTFSVRCIYLRDSL